MKNDTFSYIYYRHIPNVFFKQKLKEIHRKLKSKLINQGIENGILVSIFALGCNGKCNEIIFIKSYNKLSALELNRIVNELYNLEIYFFKQTGNNQSRYEISCFGVTAQSCIQNIDFLKHLNNHFKKWENYNVKSYNKDKVKIEKNYKVSNGELAFIGFLNSDIAVRNLNDLLSVKLIEEIFNLKTSILTEIRNQGLCYTTVSKFHEDLNIIYTGIVVSYSQKLLGKLNNMFSEVEIFEKDFIQAKERLKKEIIFSTTLYQSEHYLLPYQILDPNTDITLLLDLTNRIKFENIIQIFNNRKFVCLKITQ
ncbi:hypothetical protein AB3329_01585 [Streptococcus sp. H31]|uniref:hypothetical protein n=1 Tax=Streptococcus huangxiaojuni TaxID=3237239 RepID=UPI0034A377EA